MDQVAALRAEGNGEFGASGKGLANGVPREGARGREKESPAVGHCDLPAGLGRESLGDLSASRLVSTRAASLSFRTLVLPLRRPPSWEIHGIKSQNTLHPSTSTLENPDFIGLFQVEGPVEGLHPTLHLAEALFDGLFFTAGGGVEGIFYFIGSGK